MSGSARKSPSVDEVRRAIREEWTLEEMNEVKAIIEEANGQMDGPRQGLLKGLGGVYRTGGAPLVGDRARRVTPQLVASLPRSVKRSKRVNFGIDGPGSARKEAEKIAKRLGYSPVSTGSQAGESVHSGRGAGGEEDEYNPFDAEEEEEGKAEQSFDEALSDYQQEEEQHLQQAVEDEVPRDESEGSEDLTQPDGDTQLEKHERIELLKAVPRLMASPDPRRREVFYVNWSRAFKVWAKDMRYGYYLEKQRRWRVMKETMLVNALGRAVQHTELYQFAMTALEGRSDFKALWDELARGAVDPTPARARDEALLTQLGQKPEESVEDYAERADRLIAWVDAARPEGRRYTAAEKAALLVDNARPALRVGLRRDPTTFLDARLLLGAAAAVEARTRPAGAKRQPKLYAYQDEDVDLFEPHDDLEDRITQLQEAVAAITTGMTGMAAAFRERGPPPPREPCADCGLQHATSTCWASGRADPRNMSPEVEAWLGKLRGAYGEGVRGRDLLKRAGAMPRRR